MKVSFTWILILFSLNAFTQSLGRQVIGCTGHKSGGVISSSTVGPSNLNTVSSGDFIFTQGFQQPNESAVIIEFVVSSPDCFDINGGAVQVLVSGCSGPFEFEWETGDSTDMVENLSPGYYSLTISGSNCTIQDSVLLELDENCDSFIPNLITPNFDGDNDFLNIPEINVGVNLENQIQIFNRWGNMVWQTSNYDNQENSWSGYNSKNEPLPSGTYFYVYKTEDGESSGFIELLR